MTRFFVIVVLCISLSAYGKDDAGFLLKISGASKDVKVLRSNQLITPSEFLRLETGDQVSVSSDGTHIELSLSNGQYVRVDKAHPHTMAAATGNYSITDNLFSWVASSLAPSTSKPRTKIASSKGPQKENADELSMPLIKDGATLIAGERPVALAWLGGAAPFQVQLIRRDTRVVAFVGASKTNRFVETVRLTPGAYEVLVHDANNREWREKVIAVADQKLPSSPASFKEFPPEIGEILNITWLAGLDQGKWILEAYARLATKPQRTDTENQLLVVLEAGRIPEQDR
jgi:hypothetical protein